VLSVQSLHQEDSMIKDALFLKNDALNKKLIVTCSSQPRTELKVSEIYSTDDKKYGFTQLASTKEDHNGVFNCLSANPLNNEFICSGSNFLAPSLD